jgi:alpha-tubulin suppressor-like RCC1 family protein
MRPRGLLVVLVATLLCISGLITGPTLAASSAPGATLSGPTSSGATAAAFEAASETLGVQPASVYVGASMVAAGDVHTCALAASVMCWGNDGYGQLGDGKVRAYSTIPVAVEGLVDVTAIAAGAGHTCAIVYNGNAVKCWGDNSAGQLGDGTQTDRSTPVTVLGLTSTAVAITAGAYHTCVLTALHTVVCWGYNAHGQLGIGSSVAGTTSAGAAAVTANATSVSAGGQHTCATLSSGTPVCWGENGDGELGNGTTEDAYAPTHVNGWLALGSSTGSAITAGAHHTCALDGAAVACWGWNRYGQLGDGSTTDRLTPVQVSGITTATSAFTGDAHTCARLLSGTLSCWGWNGYGQLGDGTTTNRSTPVAVPGISSAMTGDGGSEHTCVALADGTLRCWGQNSWSQLGDGTIANRTTPVAVSGLSTVSAIAAGGGHTCALITGGSVRCWGYNGNGELGDATTESRAAPVAVSGITTAVSVAAGARHTCAVLANGRVWCWGSNALGELGDGTTTSRSTPVQVAGITTALAMTAGDFHTCALLAGGAVSCWGYNAYGELGDGSTTDRPSPVAASGITTATQLSAGGYHTCARLGDGTARCWGLNDFGQLGDGTTTTRTTPVAVPGLSGVTQIGGGGFHTCAALSGGALRCWGDNAEGQVGDGTTTNRSTPVAVSGITTGTAVAGGTFHTCALLSGGAARCWGYAGDGQLGNGSTTGGATPVAPSGITTATAVAAGYRHSCVLLTAGTVMCWGSNDAGQLGDGTFGFKSAPVPVIGFGLPTAPTGVVATPGDAQAAVTWVASSSGGVGLVGYTVTSKPGGRTCTTTGLECTVTGLTNGTSYTFTVKATNTLGSGPSSTASAPVIPNPPGSYHAVSPARLLDTRSANGLSGAFSANTARTFQVTGRGGVPAGATAVTGNLTVTEQSALGYLFIGPGATNAPSSSTLNFPVGDNRANAVTVGLSPTGTLSVTYAAPSGSKTAVIFDVTGYFTPDATGDTYHPLTPARFLDTRSGVGSSGTVAGGGWVTFQVANRTVSGVNVPASATAVTGNLTVTEQTALGYLYAAPTRGTVASSTLNFPVGDNRANAVTVGLSAAGTSGASGTCATTKGCLSVYYGAPATARTHVIFDVTGYFTADSTGLRYVPINPTRVLDSRYAIGLSGLFSAKSSRTFSVAGVGGVPSAATAITGNLTVTQQSALGYLFLGPNGTNAPTSSTLNFPVGDNRANAVTVGLKAADGTLSLVYAAPTGATTHAILDVTGYFIAPG